MMSFDGLRSTLQVLVLPNKVFLNSVGDSACLDDEMFVAIRNAPPLFEIADLSFEQDFVPADPSPEPGSLLLVGTGPLLFVAAVHRKANRPPVSYFD
jgi:hypothetical protein